MEQKNIMVSVLIISYNQRTTIQQALESVLEQRTRFSVEILVGDDHSGDGTAEIIAEIAQVSALQTVLRPRNLGATRNLYNLQERARGKYLAYLEGDDYWCDPSKLQKQVDFLESHLEYIGCTHRCCIVDEDGRPFADQHLRWVAERDVYTLRDFHGIVLPGHGSTIMHRNIFLGSGGRYEELMTLHPLIGDRPLCLLLASLGKIYRIPETMSCYRRVRKRNTSTNATAVAYTLNPNWIRDDYELTKKLESYALLVLKVDGGFLNHKKELFASAVWAALRHTTRTNFSLVFQMLREGNAVSYLASFPSQAIRKYREKREG